MARNSYRSEMIFPEIIIYMTVLSTSWWCSSGQGTHILLSHTFLEPSRGLSRCSINNQLPSEADDEWSLVSDYLFNRVPQPFQADQKKCPEKAHSTLISCNSLFGEQLRLLRCFPLYSNSVCNRAWWLGRRPYKYVFNHSSYLEDAQSQLL